MSAKKFMYSNTFLCLLVFLLFSSCSSSQVKKTTPKEDFVSTASKPSMEEVSLFSKDQREDKAENLNTYILQAISKSAELRQSFEMYNAALKKSPQVSALPDPNLNFAYFVKEVETRVGPQQQKLGIQQPIPWFGKLNLKGEIADSEAKAAFFAFLSKKNKIVSDVVKAYFELVYLNSAIEITGTNFELLKSWEQILSQRYRAQSGTQADLIKVQVELGMLEDKLNELRDLKLPLQVAFNSILNRESILSVYAPSSVLSEAIFQSVDSVVALDQRALEGLLSENNPDLLFVQELIEAKKKGVRLANKNFYPDFAIGTDYVFVGNRNQAGTGSGEDSMLATVSFTLPLYRGKYEAALSQAKEEKQSAEELKKAKTNELNALLARTSFEIKDAKRRIELHRNTLVPKAEESLNSSFTAFEVGSSSFIDLLDAERTLLQFKLALSKAQADLQVSNTQLLSLLGRYSTDEKIQNLYSLGGEK